MAIGQIDQIGRPPPDHVLDRRLGPVGLRQHVFLEDEQYAAPDGGKHEQRHGQAVQTDAARPQHGQFAVLAERPHRDQDRNEDRNRNQVIDVLRRRVPEKVEQECGGDVGLEQLVREIDDRADVEETEQAYESQRHDAGVLAHHVEVDQLRSRHTERGHANDQHGSGDAGG